MTDDDIYAFLNVFRVSRAAPMKVREMSLASGVPIYKIVIGWGLDWSAATEAQILSAIAAGVPAEKAAVHTGQDQGGTLWGE